MVLVAPRDVPSGPSRGDIPWRNKAAAGGADFANYLSRWFLLDKELAVVLVLVPLLVQIPRKTTLTAPAAGADL